MPPTHRLAPGQRSGLGARRFSIRDAVVVVSLDVEPPSWAHGVVVGVTYGTTPLYDILLDDGAMLRHVPASRMDRPGGS